MLESDLRETKVRERDTVIQTHMRAEREKEREREREGGREREY